MGPTVFSMSATSDCGGVGRLSCEVTWWYHYDVVLVAGARVLLWEHLHGVVWTQPARTRCGESETTECHVSLIYLLQC